MYSSRRSMRAGHKKGAHYSAPMSPLRIRMARRNRPLPVGPGLTLLVLCALWGLALPAARTRHPVPPPTPSPPPAADTRKTEAELEAVKAEIERVSRQVGEEQVQRDKLSREL